MKAKKLFALCFLVSSAFAFIACGDGSDSSTSGTLSLGLMDAATDSYQAVYVTIDEIKVHRSDTANADQHGWTTVASPRKTFNLMELMNGVIEPLGLTELDAGTYSQMRLYLGDTSDGEKNILGEDHWHPHYVILDDVDDTVKELTVPSGYQTGVKLVREFEIVGGLTVDLVLDFDACASVVKAGASGKYLLKPTIKIIDTVNNAILSGTVTDDSLEPAYLDGARVSAQYYEEGAPDPITYTATQTVGGDYMMYLPPNNYNIVAYKSGYAPACANITTVFEDILIKDFTLAAVTPVTVTVNVSYISTPDPDDPLPTATISFRKVLECTPAIDQQVIEVDQLNVAGEGGFQIDLPQGEYSYVASSNGMVTISGGINTVTPTLNIEFEGSSPTP